jgi:hypothetical protein
MSQLAGVAHVLLQNFFGYPEVPFSHSVDGGGEVRLDVFVSQETLDAQEEQSAELLVGELLVEDDGPSIGEAEPEGAQVLAEGDGQGGAVENEDGRS